jgi:ABC-type amino acid transport substrate-binding protein
MPLLETIVVKRRALCTAAAGAMLGAGTLIPAAAQDLSGLARAKARGTLVVGVYNALPPFNVDGRGIDVDIAQELAKELGLRLSLLPFNADENMADDLRNMVWRGHYLGFGPADVLLHVPVDKPLMDDQPRVLIFGPYYRETVAMARNLDKLPRMEQLSDLKKERVAVPGQTLAGWLMIGAESGAYRDQLSTQFSDGVAAAQALKKGDVSAACATASELHHALSGDQRYAIEPLPVPRAPRNGWAVGMAVKKDSDDLARTLQAAINAMGADGRLVKIFKDRGVPWKPV